MSDKSKEATQYGTQYTAFSNDMRFYADQRFKIVTVFLVTSGIFANVAADHASVLLGFAGIVLAYACFSWEQGTTVWWGTLITRCQEIEELLVKNEVMIPGYKTYKSQNPKVGFQRVPYLKPSYAVVAIYMAGAVGWAIFAVWSWPNWLASPWPE